MNEFFIPANKPEDWKSFLADEKHWKTGYSAKSLAYCWQEANDFPKEVKKIFDNSNLPIISELKLLVAFPEYKVPLEGGPRCSQNDIFILAKGDNQLVVITVEGKVSEDFGKTIGEWRFERDQKTNKPKRLEFLLKELNLDGKDVDKMRYQLFHRTASAVIGARKFTAKHAVMLVHSFSQTYEHFDDYVKFISLFGLEGKKDILVGPTEINDINLCFGWVRGDKEFLER